MNQQGHFDRDRRDGSDRRGKCDQPTKDSCATVQGQKRQTRRKQDKRQSEQLCPTACQSQDNQTLKSVDPCGKTRRKGCVVWPSLQLSKQLGTLLHAGRVKADHSLDGSVRLIPSPTAFFFFPRSRDAEGGKNTHEDSLGQPLTVVIVNGEYQYLQRYGIPH